MDEQMSLDFLSDMSLLLFVLDQNNLTPVGHRCIFRQILLLDEFS